MKKQVGCAPAKSFFLQPGNQESVLTYYSYYCSYYFLAYYPIEIGLIRKYELLLAV